MPRWWLQRTPPAPAAGSPPLPEPRRSAPSSRRAGGCARAAACAGAKVPPPSLFGLSPQGGASRTVVMPCGMTVGCERASASRARARPARPGAFGRPCGARQQRPDAARPDGRSRRQRRARCRRHRGHRHHPLRPGPEAAFFAAHGIDLAATRLLCCARQEPLSRRLRRALRGDHRCRLRGAGDGGCREVAGSFEREESRSARRRAT